MVAKKVDLMVADLGSTKAVAKAGLMVALKVAQSVDWKVDAWVFQWVERSAVRMGSLLAGWKESRKADSKVAHLAHK